MKEERHANGRRKMETIFSNAVMITVFVAMVYGLMVLACKISEEARK